MGISTRQKLPPSGKPKKRLSLSSVLFVSVLLLFAGCVKQPLPEAGSPAVDVYIGKCGLCHEPYHPQAHTYIGWKTVVTRMEKNAQAKGIERLLSDDERTTILAYLEKNARKGF
ncbi:hypothetical protein BAC1_00417 [uncultured bacterium]|nr:hypothetical protein BAC1_00417 [uncultured bacterium]